MGAGDELLDVANLQSWPMKEKDQYSFAKWMAGVSLNDL